MVYIKKSTDKQYYAIVENDKNKKVLATTELHTQKHNCWKNIFALAECFRPLFFFVIDQSVADPKNYYCSKGQKFIKPLGALPL